MGAFLARSQHNSSILYICVQWIARANIEAAAKRPWKHDLSLRGNFGLHGKTILLCFSSLGNPESFLIGGDSTRWLDQRLARSQTFMVPRPTD
jgi:hypothetical protein